MWKKRRAIHNWGRYKTWNIKTSHMFNIAIWKQDFHSAAVLDSLWGTGRMIWELWCHCPVRKDNRGLINFLFNSLQNSEAWPYALSHNIWKGHTRRNIYFSKPVSFDDISQPHPGSSDPLRQNWQGSSRQIFHTWPSGLLLFLQTMHAGKESERRVIKQKDYLSGVLRSLYKAGRSF